MRFRRAAPTALIVTIVAVVATMTFVANRLFSGLTVAVEEGQYALMRSSVEASLRDEESRAVARAEIVAAIPAIRSAFAARDRPRLLAETEEMFRVQHDRFGVDQMSFHVAPATVYLRVHNPGRSGDDVGAARPMVTVANLTHTSQQGLAFSSSTGPGFFGVVPVRDAQGQHVGCFEVGVDVEPEIDALKVKFALDLTLFVDEQQLRTYSTGLRGEVLNDQNRVGRFLKYHSTNWALMQRLVRSTDLARASRPVQYSRSAGGRTYGVVLLPVRSTSLYREDRLGLKALDARGALLLLDAPGGHMQFSEAWFVEHVVRPYLAPPPGGLAAAAA